MQCHTTTSSAPLISTLPHGWCLTSHVSQVFWPHATSLQLKQTHATSYNLHCFAGCQQQTCWVYQGLTVRLSMLCFQTFPAQLQHRMPTSGNGVTLVQHQCCMTLSSMFMQSRSLAYQQQPKRQKQQEQQQQQQQNILQPLCSRPL